MGLPETTMSMEDAIEKWASLAARQLINALLQRDPTSRLGSTTSANEIKQHLFFHGINWPLIRNM
ncbi:Phototropin-2, partial [Mucuna pruriens]